MMQALWKRLNSKKRGFTLIELIIVIAILAILAAILIPSMLGIVRDSKDKVKITNARSVYSAAHQAYTSLAAEGKILNEAKDLTSIYELKADGELSEEDLFLNKVFENLGAGFVSEGASEYVISIGALGGSTEFGVTKVEFRVIGDDRVAIFKPGEDPVVEVVTGD